MSIAHLEVQATYLYSWLKIDKYLVEGAVQKTPSSMTERPLSQRLSDVRLLGSVTV